MKGCPSRQQQPAAAGLVCSKELTKEGLAGLLQQLVSSDAERGERK